MSRRQGRALPPKCAQTLRPRRAAFMMPRLPSRPARAPGQVLCPMRRCAYVPAGWEAAACGRGAPSCGPRGVPLPLRGGQTWMPAAPRGAGPRGPRPGVRPALSLERGRQCACGAARERERREESFCTHSPRIRNPQKHSRVSRPTQPSDHFLPPLNHHDPHPSRRCGGGRGRLRGLRGACFNRENSLVLRSVPPRVCLPALPWLL